MNEVGELDFGNWPQPFHREADGNTSNGEFGHRCVYDALWAKALQQTLGRTEDAAECANIFAQDEDSRVARHLFAQRSANGFNHGHVWH